MTDEAHKREMGLVQVVIADTITRMENVKHAFDAGIKARRGVDF